MFCNLKAELKRNGITNKELSKKLRVTNKTIFNKLNGYSEFTLSEIQIISEIFPDLKLDYLFAEENN